MIKLTGTGSIENSDVGYDSVLADNERDLRKAIYPLEINLLRHKLIGIEVGRISRNQLARLLRTLRSGVLTVLRSYFIEW